MFGRFGKAGKAGKQQRNTVVPGAVSGPSTGTNEIGAAPFRFGRNPIAASYAARLGIASALTSPMVAGRFRPQDRGSAPRRAAETSSYGTPDLGVLQTFAGSFQGPGSARLGAQSGPSSQPGFPSTNRDSSVDLSGLGLPDVWRVRSL